jgi:hypothetical protein
MNPGPVDPRFRSPRAGGAGGLGPGDPPVWGGQFRVWLGIHWRWNVSPKWRMRQPPATPRVRGR